MRNRLLFLLLATASMPAIAADDASDRAAAREAARAERAEARSERQAEREAERAQDAPRPERPAEARAIEPRSQDRPIELDRPVPVRVIERRLERDLGHDSPRPTLDQRREAIDQRRGDDVDSVRNWRREEREQVRTERAGRAPGPKTVLAPAGPLRETLRERRRERIEGRDSIGNRRAPVVSRVPREGTQPPPLTRSRPSSLSAQHWRGDWRGDRRYDWRSHRRRHRNLFHFGFYFDPFGWGYRPYSIGWRLWPSYFGSSYWLNDPWMYRLPPAFAGQRWIRYYDDALLVDTFTGEVVDVIHNFFW